MISQPSTRDNKFSKISAASSGDNTIISAVADQKIRVLMVIIMSGGTVNATFQSGASGTALTGAMPLIANVGFSSGYSEIGHFETGFGELLNLSLSGSTQVSGWIVYQLKGE